MARQYVLVVEDDEDIQQLVGFNLLKAGFHVTCADSGEDGLRRLETERVDLVLLDVMLPGISGVEVCRAIKGDPRRKRLPVIMLTARDEEDDVVAGLDSGADDYVTKPFSVKVLVARIKSALRRKPAEDELASREEISIHGLSINPGRHEVTVGGESVSLTMTEFNILLLLARRPGWVFSRQQIIDAVRGSDFLVTPRAMDVQIFGLRRKLGEAGACIETVRGIGYRFKE